MKKSFLIYLSFLLFSFKGFAQNDYRFFDNFSANDTVFELRVKSDEVSKSYKIRIYANDSTYKESINLSTNYDLELFYKTLTQLLNSDKLKPFIKSKQTEPKLANSTTKSKEEDTFDFTPNEALKLRWKTSYEALMKDLNKKEVLTELYDKQNIEFSGKLKLKNQVKLKFDSKIDDKNAVEQLLNFFKNTDSIKDKEKQKNISKKDSLEPISPIITFIPKNASVRFFNNRLNTIAIHGTIDGVEYTLVNNKFSVPFRFINRPGSILKVEYNSSYYHLEWNDLFDYNPDESEFNYAVKNKSYAIKANEEIKVESRNLFDYFTGIIFTDFLGLSSDNNSLLMAEGRVIIPLASRNYRIWNAPQYFEAYLNTSIYNGQEEDQGFVKWSDPILTGGIPSKISMFEFFKKRNIETGLNYGIGSLEWKNISTIITLDYGINFYRSRLEYIKDSNGATETFQAYALGHGPKLKFEIRPQVNFGADINMGVLGYNFNGFNNSIGYADFKNTVIEQKTTLYNMAFLTTNFYTKLNSNEANGGMYFRLAGFYDLKTSEVSPQIMVGYATNLTTFINKFKKKDE